MSVTGLVSIRNAISKLNPKQVREMSERPLRIALYSASPECYQRMEDFFLRDLSPTRRNESSCGAGKGTSWIASSIPFRSSDLRRERACTVARRWCSNPQDPSF